MKQKILIGFAPFALTHALTLKPVVISATLNPHIPWEASDRLDSEEMAFHHRPSIGEQVGFLEGVQLFQSGGSGQLPSIFVRGAPMEQVSVTYNSIPLHDVMSPAGTPFLNALNTGPWDSMRLVRGPASTRMGSDAIGGSLEIHTSPRPQSLLASHVGSRNFRGFSLAHASSSELFSSYFSAQREHEDGISAASSRLGHQEQDGYSSLNLKTGMQWNPRPGYKLDLHMMHSRYESELDDLNFLTGLPTDLPDSTTNGRFSGASIRLRTQRRNASDDTSIAISRFQRKNHHPVYLESEFMGREVRIRFQRSHHLKSRTVTWGGEYRQENGQTGFQNNYDANQLTSLFVESQDKLAKNLTLTSSLRQENHSSYTPEWTYRLQPVLTFKASTFFAGVSRGYQAPSLYQLYDTAFGNPLLKPALADSLEFGWKYRLRPDLHLKTTLFRIKTRDMVDYDFPSKGYINRSRTTSEGFESGLEYTRNKWVTSIFYTHLDSIDALTLNPLPRRAKHHIQFQSTYRMNQRWKADLTASKFIRRQDVLAGKPIEMPDLFAANLSLNYQIRANQMVFFQIRNITNQQAEEISGYGRLGRSCYIGLQWSF